MVQAQLAASAAQSTKIRPAMSRNAFRRQKRKQQKQQKQQHQEDQDNPQNEDQDKQYKNDGDQAQEKDLSQQIEPQSDSSRDEDDKNVTDEADRQISSQFEIDESDPLYEAFQRVFNAYDAKNQGDIHVEHSRGEVYFSDDDQMSEEAEEQIRTTLSKSKARKARRPTVAQLKQQVARPDVVEWYDVASLDPLLLIFLKSYPNAVQVPEHWSQKRGYLSNKRGVEKLPFELPAFIRATGILELRDSAKEREPETLRGKMRERVRPRLGKLDIDYQKLHDAFFRFQTKCPMLSFGDLYHEGKEHESNVQQRRPGDLSDELKQALGMPSGAPPPWLINMQRYGPPPSYPGLKIPGLNAPIPSGAQWGYHPGGWGKPPVDEFNRPLYGDVFGVQQSAATNNAAAARRAAPIEREHWGEFDPTIEEEDEEDEEEYEEDIQNGEIEGSSAVANAVGGVVVGGITTPSGLVSSVPSEIDAPAHIELRKSYPDTHLATSATGLVSAPTPAAQARDQARLEDDEETTIDGQPLYKVLPQQERKIEGFMGSQYGYDVADDRKRRNVPEDSGSWEADLSDMVAEQAAQASRKRQRHERVQKEKIKF